MTVPLRGITAKLIRQMFNLHRSHDVIFETPEKDYILVEEDGPGSLLDGKLLGSVTQCKLLADLGNSAGSLLRPHPRLLDFDFHDFTGSTQQYSAGGGCEVDIKLTYLCKDRHADAEDSEDAANVPRRGITSRLIRQVFDFGGDVIIEHPLPNSATNCILIGTSGPEMDELLPDNIHDYRIVHDCGVDQHVVIARLPSAAKGPSESIMIKGGSKRRASASSGTVEKEGWLKKKSSGVFKSWQKRYQFHSRCKKMLLTPLL
jgi:hypothetical protein